MRLRHAGGEWTLEAEQLVAVERDLYRPAKRTIRGSEPILTYLRRQGASASLREATLQLLRARREEDASFDWISDEWVPTDKGRSQAPLASEAASLLSELRAELLMLRASHAALKDRVRSAEERVRTEYAQPNLRGPAAPSERPKAEQKSSASSNDDGPPPLDAEAHRVEPLDAEGRRVEPLDAAVGFPTKSAVLGALKQLLGADPELEYTVRAPPPSSTGLSGSLLVNREGQPVGAVLANARAVAELGGGLLGLPASAIDALAGAATPSEDTVAAMSEFCNLLAAAVSRASDGMEVRAQPIVPALAERLRWLADAANSAVLASRAGAELWLVTR